MSLEVDNMNTEERRQHDLLLRRDNMQGEFQGYYYDDKKSNHVKKDDNNATTVRLMK